ncbi:MAG: copper homeostasis protein CutC [Clostridium sp.]|uniref:copper homeostasis protein CutC n=1 Tax=Clostridium sp. TaxID=1506 RepID=UPI002A85B560|nr:copper homeostasis protein CutC [Clostridium sp.]MDY5097159.1 copper homeostasis protein CutC [Clostridium sp.]
MAIFEACVGNYVEAKRAEELGANRLELCDNLLEGGTTPSYGTIKKVLEKINIPVMVIMRPRGGDFEFLEEEIEIMKDDIRMAKELGAYGVVIGALKGNKVDIDTTKAFIEEAKPLSVTFHMAFDDIEDKFEAVDQLVALGVDRILTKGGTEDAMSGKDELRKLSDYAAGRITIMPGKGVNKGNRDFLLEYVNTDEIHGSKVV